ncbi:hypothetical protein L916_05053 [Phytophthora nicotianae]|uniref:Uncharacterized protein n=1 Tax=Phytophthora nicotianae TaxID=4792 RepID=W2JGJ1_PHYNI|nr:hypothetical protein L916_05053 [Phytophthora nicotianae]
MSLQLLKIAIIIPFELMVRDNRAEVDATSGSGMQESNR